MDAVNPNATKFTFCGFNLVKDDGVTPARAYVGDRLVYVIEIFAAVWPSTAATNLIGDASGSNGNPVATPILDDISLIYFLPTNKVLLKERMWD